MVAGAYPLAKLGYLALRQISKPVANALKNGAKRSHLFRNYVCLPTAQVYHRAETAFKMYLLGLGKPVHVAPLNEQMAVELGADILGECLVFLFAAATVTYEVTRSSAKAKAKEDELYGRLDALERGLADSRAHADRLARLLARPPPPPPPTARVAETPPPAADETLTERAADGATFRLVRRGRRVTVERLAAPSQPPPPTDSRQGAVLSAAADAARRIAPTPDSPS